MPRYSKGSNELIYQIASQALLEAMDALGERQNPQYIMMYIKEQAGACEGVAGYSPQDIIQAYWSAGAFLTEGYQDIEGNIEFQWPTHNGTLQELLCIGAVYYIAQVAKELYEQEYSQSKRDLNMSDYPIGR